MKSPAADARILIIGYGNTLRGDDGVGPVAAERLGELLPERLVNVIAAHQLLPEHTEPLSRVDLAIFIDACCDLPPGELSCKTIEPRTDVSGSMTHHLDPPTLLALSHRLFGHLPRAYLITVGGKSFGLEPQLSPVMQACLGRVIDQVNQLIRDYNPTDCASSRPGEAADA
ncbi:MAG: hydrogenase maturation protease [Bacillota bacterium]